MAFVFDTNPLKIAAGQIKQASTTDVIVTNALSQINYLINGGFDVAARGASFTVANDAYGPDQWLCYREDAAGTRLQYDRTDVSALAPNVNSLYGGRFTRKTDAGRLFVCNIIEGVNCVPLRGKAVTFQVRMRSSDAARAVRMAVLQLAAAGTMDTMPAAIITAWGASNTYGTNVAEISPGYSEKTVGTTYDSYSITVTVPTDAKNLICAVWTPNDVDADDWIELAEAGLFEAATVRDWTPRPIEIEYALCQRYFWRLANSSAADAIYFTGLVTSATETRGVVQFPTPMRVAPTLGFGFSALSDFYAYDGSAAPTVTGLTIAAGGSGTANRVARLDWVASGGGLTAGRAGLLISATSGAYIDFSAEL